MALDKIFFKINLLREEPMGDIAKSMQQDISKLRDNFSASTKVIIKLSDKILELEKEIKLLKKQLRIAKTKIRLYQLGEIKDWK